MAKGWGAVHWGVESERDMYNYGTRRANTSTRMAGLATSLAIIGGLGVVVLTWKTIVPDKEEKGEVAIIDVAEEVEEPPPPPPPVDVELPPPPPMVVVPQFEFDVPPPPAAIVQVAPAVNRPAAAPPQPAAKPAPPPAPSLRSKPKPGRRFDKPDYPAAAKRANEEGEVVVSVCVDVEGRMSNVQIVKSSGFPRLDEATVTGLSKTRLDPAIGTDGKPIAMCNPPYTFTWVWDLEEEKRR